MRVLVVDDVSELRQVIRWMLEVEGATVLEARDGREALRLAQTEPVDVALTDLGLPDMSGEDIVAGLRSLSQGRIPVAVISGAGRAALEHALEVGAERAFPKPVDRDDLVRYLTAARKVAEGWLPQSVLPRRA